jgi:hypothetical protein
MTGRETPHLLTRISALFTAGALRFKARRVRGARQLGR